jgi:hypothetical protein
MMVAYSFEARFEEPILAGVKRSTIQPIGQRRHAYPGDELQLYGGMRTKACRLLMRVPCLSTTSIAFTSAGAVTVWGGGSFHMGMRSAEMADLAAHEGFDGVEEMMAWFEDRYGLPTPTMIRMRWNPATATFAAEVRPEVLQ